MKKSLFCLVLCAAVAAGNANATVTFSTFVSSASIAAVEGQNNTIAFNYAGDEFIGSVYLGSNNLQLYSTNTSGGDVQKFGSPITNGFAGEVVVGVSLGQGGFAAGKIYAGAGNEIYSYAHSGGTPTPFFNTPDGATVRQVFFDPGSSFSGNMLVTTTSGKIWQVTSSGAGTLLANVGEDAEGMDIATSNLGGYAGDLLVSSEGSGDIRAISPGGAITILQNASGADIHISEAETVSVVPLNLGASGNPVEGFYVANYPDDIQYAVASEFAGLQGDIIVTEEQSSNSPVMELTLNPDGTSFSMTQIGTLPGQSEDGIFVTAQRIGEVPEPGTLSLLGLGLAGVGLLRRRKAH